MAKRNIIETELRKPFTTPIGTARFCYLNRPFEPKDATTGASLYKTDLILTPDEAEPFIASLRERLEKMSDWLVQCAGVKPAKVDPNNRGKINIVEPWRMEEDEDGYETGNYIFKFKMHPVIGKADNRRTQRPRLVDSQGNPINPEQVFIYGGSRIKIGVTPAPYYMPATNSAGLTMYLKAVQVLELASSMSDNFDFEIHEGGFSVSSLEDTSFDVDSMSNNTTSDDEDDDMF